MIDVHCHILPKADGGPQDMQASLEMAKQAIEQGIHTVVAAPAHLDGSYQNEKSAVLEHIQTYTKQLAEHNIPLKVLPGQQIYLTEDLLEMVEEEKLLTIDENGKYLLLACSGNHVPVYTESLLYHMQLRGVVPVFSGLERNEHMLAQPDFLYQLVKKGAIVQLGAKSIKGAFGPKVKKFAFQLLKANLAHVIATESSSPDDGFYSLKEAYAEIKKKIGIEKVYMLQENADYIIKGQMVHREQPIRIAKKRFGIF
jgi:protein-tyrosine phosphatase